MITKEQKRSKFALEQLEKKFSTKIEKKTANFLVGLPTMILQNGLGQTLAFLFSKAGGKTDTHQYKAGEIILKWANENGANLGGDLKESLLKISTINADKYIKLQKEVLAMLNWLKRYARAFEE